MAWPLSFAAFCRVKVTRIDQASLCRGGWLTAVEPEMSLVRQWLPALAQTWRGVDWAKAGREGQLALKPHLVNIEQAGKDADRLWVTQEFDGVDLIRDRGRPACADGWREGVFSVIEGLAVYG